MIIFAQQRFWWLSSFLLFALLGCERSQQDKPGQVAERYSPPDPGLLLNAGFEQDEAGRLPHWSLTQHAGNTSYAVRVENGELVVERTGPEPWGKIRQRFLGKNLEPHLGKTLEFSAELSGDFTDEFGGLMEPSGITVLVKGKLEGSHPMAGSSIILSKRSEITDSVGNVSWHRHAVQFTLPTPDEAIGVDLELAVLMTGSGSLRIRGPSLIEVPSP